MNLKRDFSAPIRSLSGDPMPSGASVATLTQALDIVLSMVPDDKVDGARKAVGVILGVPLTLGVVAATAVTAAIPGETTLPAGDSSKRLALALKVHAGGEVEITPEERDLLKERIAKFYLGAIVPGRAADLLEGAAEPAARV